MGALALGVIAVCYLIATIDFAVKKDWPWVLVSFGCFMVLLGNLWAIQRGGE
jgi:hypothetical protein